ncbi:hypothetical protein F4780DRAFT_150989 [Xylariomycetidae sp. FL0641]|nr:hypothetical protein F4780DRAFT_150989 [Xylariomycetidae sp. FL0641]
MSWHETDEKGVFARPLGENETFLKLIGDAGRPLHREPLAITASATLAAASSELSPPRLRRAWAHLRFRHPSLAAEASADTLRYTVPASAAALDAWLDTTFRVAPAEATAADVVAAVFAPAPSAVLVLVPRDRALLLHSAHWRTDGLGALLLLDSFLDLAASDSARDDPAALPWGEEPARLAPSVEALAHMPLTPTPAQRARAEELAATFSLAAGTVGIPCRPDAAAQAVPGGTRRAALALTPAQTAQVVAACKQRGVSVTAAVHASVAGANYALAEKDGATRHYASTARFSLRPHLPHPDPAGLYSIGWTVSVPADADWDARARAYHAEYRRGTAAFAEEGGLAPLREYAARLGGIVRRVLGGEWEGEEPSDVDISSLGVADKVVRRTYGTPGEEGCFEVLAVHVGVEVLTRQGGVFVWTFRDRLNLSVGYNEAFHEAAQMEGFVRVVRDRLLEGLGIRD